MLPEGLKYGQGLQTRSQKNVWLLHHELLHLPQHRLGSLDFHLHNPVFVLTTKNAGARL